jgi:hypothetical protein
MCRQRALSSSNGGTLGDGRNPSYGGAMPKVIVAVSATYYNDETFDATFELDATDAWQAGAEAHRRFVSSELDAGRFDPARVVIEANRGA